MNGLGSSLLVAGIFVGGFVMMHHRLRQIHVLVNSKFSTAIDALSTALRENVALKDRLGDPVTKQERSFAEHPTADERSDTP